MKIKSFKYDDPRAEGWSLDPLVLKDGINLFVGATGSGKTRVLNIFFNLGAFAGRDRFANGQWILHFEHSGTEYTWKCDSERMGDDREPRVLSEELWIGTPDHVETSLLIRTEREFSLSGKDVPKLATASSAIYLLREEEAIKPVHEAFSRLLRRRFWSEDLAESVNLEPVPPGLVKKLTRRADLLEVFKSGTSLHARLYLLERYFSKEFAVISEQFTRVFPFVTDLRVRTAAEALGAPTDSNVHVALIKERGVDNAVVLNEIASGMQKVLLIITDIVTAPADVLYMIDEYENSLGVNAIDFLPSFIADCGGKRQFIITTHHPLLINAIPVSDWFILHRRGLHIRVTHGASVEARYGRSKQQRFIQLINDPLYREGVE